MAKSKPKRDRHTITLARAKTEPAQVADPNGDGKPVTVNRIVDPLANLYRHKHITQLQFAAGDRYRSAVEITSAAPGGSMDFNRTRGSVGIAPGAPPMPFIFAAESVREAKQKLWPRHFAIVHRITVLGMTFERVSQELNALDFGRIFVRRDIATIFSESLDMLAEMWWPDATPQTDRYGQELRKITASYLERAVATGIQSIEARDTTAHVTRDKVYWSDLEKRR